VCGAGGAVAGLRSGDWVPRSGRYSEQPVESLRSPGASPAGFVVVSGRSLRLFLVPHVVSVPLGSHLRHGYLRGFSRGPRSLARPGAVRLSRGQHGLVPGGQERHSRSSWLGDDGAISFLSRGTFEREKTAVRDAGWIYMVASHLARLPPGHVRSVGRRAGSFISTSSDGWPPRRPELRRNLAFRPGLIGLAPRPASLPLTCGCPGHPAAPSHVSAVMSGVMDQDGGLRFPSPCSSLPAAAMLVGWLLLVIGVTPRRAGVLFALRSTT